MSHRTKARTRPRTPKSVARTSIILLGGGSKRRQTGFGGKVLHRMLSRKGNPTSQNLFTITKAICKDLGIKLQVKVAA